MGTLIPVQFQLTSIAQPSESITDAKAGITVVMISDANGDPTSNDVLDNSRRSPTQKLRLFAEYEWLCARTSTSRCTAMP